MSGRVALVTGAARGIGAATVAALVEDGYRVMAVDVADPPSPPGVTYPLASRADLMEIQARHGDAVMTRVADVRDAGALREAADDCVREFGGLHAVVAAAAVISGGAPQWETPMEHLRALLDVDVIGAWNTAAATIPMMLRMPNPSACRFVGIASAAGDRGLFSLSGYTVAKHAVVGLVRGLAADLIGTGVTAVAVSPGSTATRMLEATASIYGTAAEQLADAQLLCRLIDPDEVARVVRFCCSLDGALMNGSVVSADGGFKG